MMDVLKMPSPDGPTPSAPSANEVLTAGCGVWTLIATPFENAAAGSPSSKSMQKNGGGVTVAQNGPLLASPARSLPASDAASAPPSASKVSVEHEAARTPSTRIHLRIVPSYVTDRTSEVLIACAPKR